MCLIVHRWGSLRALKIAIVEPELKRFDSRLWRSNSQRMPRPQEARANRDDLDREYEHAERVERNETP